MSIASVMHGRAQRVNYLLNLAHEIAHKFINLNSCLGRHWSVLKLCGDGEVVSHEKLKITILIPRSVHIQTRREGSYDTKQLILVYVGVIKKDWWASNCRVNYKRLFKVFKLEIFVTNFCISEQN